MALHSKRCDIKFKEVMKIKGRMTALILGGLGSMKRITGLLYRVPTQGTISNCTNWNNFEGKSRFHGWILKIGWQPLDKCYVSSLAKEVWFGKLVMAPIFTSYLFSSVLSLVNWFYAPQFTDIWLDMGSSVYFFFQFEQAIGFLLQPALDRAVTCWQTHLHMSLKWGCMNWVSHPFF